MSKHTMKILWLFVVLSFAAVCQVIFGRIKLSPPAVYLYYFAFAAGFLSWLYLTLRIFSFRQNLIRFVRRILANEYEAGIKISHLCEDEVSALSRQINKMAEQLVVYDGLQRDRISVMTRALDIVCHTVKSGIVIFDINKNEFRFNPGVQAVFEVEQEAIAYEAIALQPGNREFVRVLKSAIEKGAIVSNVRVSLELPVRKTQRDLFISITPVKDKNEAVDLAIIFVSAAG
jgi:nitrogen fixation/metabolism regulation signal transduction histidine kinase